MSTCGARPPTPATTSSVGVRSRTVRRATRRCSSSSPPRSGALLDLGTGDGYLLDQLRSERPGAGGHRRRLLRRDAPACGTSGSWRPTRVTVVEHADVPPPRLGSVRRGRLLVRHPPRLRRAQARRLPGGLRGLLRPGGVFLNLEHVASPTPELHDAFLYAIGSSPEGGRPVEQAGAGGRPARVARRRRLRAGGLPLEMAGAGPARRREGLTARRSHQLQPGFSFSLLLSKPLPGPGAGPIGSGVGGKL